MILIRGESILIWMKRTKKRVKSREILKYSHPPKHHPTQTPTHPLYVCIIWRAMLTQLYEILFYTSFGTALLVELIQDTDPIVFGTPRHPFLGDIRPFSSPLISPTEHYVIGHVIIQLLLTFVMIISKHVSNTDRQQLSSQR